MSHFEEFHLDFIRFEESLPPGVRSNPYDKAHNRWGWTWSQCDSGPEGFCRYWETETARNKEIADAGGVLAFILGEDSPLADLRRAMGEQWTYVDEGNHLTLVVNGSYFELSVNDKLEIVEKPKLREPRRKPRPARARLQKQETHNENQG